MVRQCPGVRNPGTGGAFRERDAQQARVFAGAILGLHVYVVKAE
jgi:hypothetical protein